MLTFIYGDGMDYMTRVEKKKMRQKITIIIFLIILTIFILWNIFRKLDYFNIQKIEIKGNEILKEETLLKNSNIKKGTNIFNISLLKEKNKIEKNPYVKEINITRKLPNEIKFNVKERKEAFILKDSNITYIIANDGLILDKIENENINRNITIINGVKFKKDTEKGNSDYIFSLVEGDLLEEIILTNLQIGILEDFKEIDFLKSTIKMIDSNNRTVDFGNTNKLNYKLSLLKETYKVIRDKDIKYERVIMDKGDNPIIVRDPLWENDVEEGDGNEG